MKKILLSLLILLSSALLIGCQLFGGVNPPKPEKPENLIYDSETELSIILGEGVENADVAEIWDALGGFLDKFPVIADDSGEKGEHEIIIGRTNREISETAYLRLDRLSRDRESDVGFLVYSDGASLAIAFDSDPYDFTLGEALKYIRSHYVLESLAVEAGIAYSDTYDLVTRIGESLGEQRLEAWEALDEELGENSAETVAALSALYGVYTSGAVDWMANLYDPDICVCDALYGRPVCENHALCGTSAFYFTSSARDNKGFLPDVESTYKVLHFLEGTGMTDSFLKLLPEEILSKISDFVYNLQDPDGYFYHPHHSKADNVSIGRRGRDLSWATSLLNSFGRSSKYSTILSSAISGGSLPDRFGKDTVAAVSRAVATETLIPSHLQSLDAFREYLEKGNINQNSYGMGNTLAAEASQIIARGSQYVDLLGEFLDSHQLENGIWHPETNYTGVNGLMKISGVYSSIGRKIPRADKALSAALASMSCPDVPSHVVDVWNPWSAATTVLENVSRFDGDAALKQARDYAMPFMSDAIRSSMNKLTIFLKENGTFSYHPKSSTSTMQGMPSAVPNTNEGDMDATVIAIQYMVGSISSVLGVDTIPIYSIAEGIRFSDIVKNLSPIRKGEAELVINDPVTFEEQDLGDDLPSNVSADASLSEIIGDPTDSGRGNVFSFSVSGSYAVVTLTSDSAKHEGASCYVFESDILFTERQSVRDFLRLDMGDGGDHTGIYRLVFTPKDNGVAILDTSSVIEANAIRNELGIFADYNEWFKLRVEYYVGNARTARAKIYFNDTLVAVSNNYYDKEGKKIGGESEPNTSFPCVQLSVPSNAAAAFCLDNLHVYKSNDMFKSEELSDPFALNVEKPVSEGVKYGFDSDGQPGLSAIGASVVSGMDGRALSLNGGSRVKLAYSQIAANPNAVSLSLNVDASGSHTGDLFVASLVGFGTSDKPIVSFTVAVDESGGERVLSVKETIGGRAISGASVSAEGIVNVRIDHYENERISLIYLNGKMLGISASVFADAPLLTFGNAVIEAKGGFLADDISLLRTSSDFDTATAPKLPSVVYGKDGVGFDPIVTEGDVSVSLEDGDEKLILNSSDSCLVRIPANKRDDATNTFVLETGLVFKTAETGRSYRISLVDGEDDPVFSFSVYSDGEKVYLRENTAIREYSANVVSFAVGDSVELRLEYYASAGECNIIVNGECVFVSGLYYNPDSRYADISAVILESSSARSELIIDSVKAESLNTLYTPKRFTNEESGSEIITFDKSGSSVISDKIEPALLSAGSGIVIKETVKGGDGDKVLSFTTAYGQPDWLVIRPTSSVSTAPCYVFETDIRFLDSFSGSPSFELNLVGEGEKAYRITIMTEGAVIFSKNDAWLSDRVTVGELCEWLRLRVEYSVSDNGGEPSMLIRVMVNDELVIEDTASYTGNVQTSLQYVQLYALISSVGSVEIDNVGFIAK